MKHPFATSLFMVLTAVSASAAVSIDWVTIGDPGNAAQSAANRTHSFGTGGDGYGAVADTYRIARNETTIADYAAFLNAVAVSGDPYGLYNSNMANTLEIVGIQRILSAGGYFYEVIGSGVRPITYVNWFDAARYTNWLHNGQGNGDTETGAYNLLGQTSGPAPGRNAEARVWLPTENEWFKAAYFDPTKGDDGGYWLHANQSDSMTGNRFSVPGAANFYDGIFAQDINSLPSRLSDAGAYGVDSQSFYGINDMAGNVWEWNDSDGMSGSERAARGGSWGNNGAFLLRSSTRATPDITFEGSNVGFRVASVPEPSSMVLTMLFGGMLLIRRKR